MIAPLQIEPHAIYDDGALVTALGVTWSTLARARRSGALRCTRQGRRVLYLGKWIIDWLEGEGTDGGPRDAA